MLAYVSSTKKELRKIHNLMTLREPHPLNPLLSQFFSIINPSHYIKPKVIFIYQKPLIKRVTP